MGRFTLPLAQVVTSDGEVGAGYLLYFYTTGSTALLNTYSDAARTVPNSNPVVADASGTFDDIYLSDVPYKVVLKDADDATIWTADPVQTATGEIGIPVPIAKGGTGATTAPNARTALGLGTAATYTVGTASDELPTNAMVTGVPTGGIMLWYGSSGSIPAGWALCNGATYSKTDGSGSIAAPDLRDKFVVGATTTYAVGATGGAVSVSTSSNGSASLTSAAGGDHAHGGSTDGHTLTIAQMPAHDHDAAMSGNYNINNVVSTNFAGTMNASAGNNTTAITSTGGGGSHSHGIQASGTHTHGVTVADHAHTASTLSPYYALCYIMKL